uniref:Uncharacterized protein n=1 Tax=Arundo donax TaxID=35708 RepID=A0A0A8YKF0_ARUDO
MTQAIMYQSRPLFRRSGPHRAVSVQMILTAALTPITHLCMLA